MSKPYPQYAAHQYPPGKKADRRKIIKCSNPTAWYADMVGVKITVHYFCTFGCWDTEGRWVDYYDLSGPLRFSFMQYIIYLVKKIFK
jgi:hypothetical protein